MSAELPLTIDALADIELTVTVLLGEAQARIADVVRYGPGTIVALNTRADSAVRLLANGTTIASGDIVETETGALAIKIKSIIKSPVAGRAAE